MSWRIDQAKIFAWDKHEGQKRKYTGENYIVHPDAVARLVREVPHTDAMICAAWLHDTVEDTNTTLEEIETNFGPVVRYMVHKLTDVSKPSDGNRVIRKSMDRMHISTASAAVKTIKLADLIDNSKSIVSHDSEFAKTYMAEKVLLLKVLKEGDDTLFHIASDIVLGYYDSLAGDDQ